MRHRFEAAVLVVWIALACATLGVPRGFVRAQQPSPVVVVVVLNAQNRVTNVSRSELRNMYLGTTGFWSGGEPVRLLMRPPTHASATAFHASVLQMTPSRFRHHWLRRQLSGQGVSPPIVDTAAQVVSRVGGSRGSIGFVTEAESRSISSTSVRLIPIR